jgi:LmbE family N-acetylglucosaminyl deacetylase
MADTRLKLLLVLAHPDDETLGMGGAVAKYAREGVEVSLVTATRGERGRYFDTKGQTPLDVVGRTREAELRCAASALGIGDVRFLDYIDGDLDRADPVEAVTRIVGHVRRIRPHVVASFGPDGGYGHPDHIAISQFATAAVVCAADSGFAPGEGEAHRTSKLYYMAWAESKWEAYQAAFKELVSHVDGVERRANPWPDWAVTTRVETSAEWPVVWRAVQCHATQIAIYSKLAALSDEYQRALWGTCEFYRVFSGVNGGRIREDDLFQGLR